MHENQVIQVHTVKLATIYFRFININPDFYNIKHK